MQTPQSHSQSESVSDLFMKYGLVLNLTKLIIALLNILSSFNALPYTLGLFLHFSNPNFLRAANVESPDILKLSVE